MHATHTTTPDGSTGSIQQTLVEQDEPNLEAFLWNVSQLDGVQTDPKPDAYCCGAVGCHLKEYLGEVRIQGFGKRVLCPKHVLDLVDREVGLGE